MRKFIISYKKINNTICVDSIVRNTISHEVFVVTNIKENIIYGSSFGDTNISDLEVVEIGIQPLNLYTNNDDISNITWNPFKKYKNKIDQNKWKADEDYCNRSFTHFISKEIEIQMIPKIGTIINGGSMYFYNTFKFILP